MNKRPGHVEVTTEVAFCTFCGRPRTLRREAHQLGTLVRTIVSCETCHRTLSSTIGVATTAEPEPVAEPVAAEPEPAPAPAAAATPALPAAKAPAAKRVSRPAAKAKPAAAKTKKRA
jgi:hypothetical protein